MSIPLTVMNRETALLLFCFSLIWGLMEWYVFLSKLWIKRDLFSSYLTPTTCLVSNMISFSIYNRQTHIHTQKVKPDTGLMSITFISSPLENKHLLQPMRVRVRVRVRLVAPSSWQGQQVGPLRSIGAIISCLVLLCFTANLQGQDTKKPRWSEHFVGSARVSSPASRVEVSAVS